MEEIILFVAATAAVMVGMMVFWNIFLNRYFRTTTTPTLRWKHYSQKVLIPFSWLWREAQKGFSNAKRFANKHWPSVKQKVQTSTSYLWRKTKAGLNHSKEGWKKYVWPWIKRRRLWQNPKKVAAILLCIVLAAGLSWYFTYGLIAEIRMPKVGWLPLWIFGILVLLGLLTYLYFKRPATFTHFPKLAKAAAWITGALLLAAGLFYLIRPTSEYRDVMVRTFMESRITPKVYDVSKATFWENIPVTHGEPVVGVIRTDWCLDWVSETVQRRAEMSGWNKLIIFTPKPGVEKGSLKSLHIYPRPCRDEMVKVASEPIETIKFNSKTYLPMMEDLFIER